MCRKIPNSNNICLFHFPTGYCLWAIGSMLLAERDGGKGYITANIVRLRVQNDLLGSFARMLISLHWQLMGIQFTICSQKKSKLGSIRSKLGEQSYTVLLCVNNKKKQPV